MVKAQKTQHPRIGRPPAGARAGERVKDYPQVSIRLPNEVKAKLQALSLITGRPQWRLITESIDCFLKALPEAEQRLVADLLRRSRARDIRKTQEKARKSRPAGA